MKKCYSPTIKTRKPERKRRRAEARKPRVLAGSIAGFCRVVAVAALAAFGAGEARAASLFWDPGPPPSGGTSLGGNGFWDLGTGAWWNGTSDQTWDNTGSTEAIFSNIGGSVNVSSALNVGALTFNGIVNYNFVGSTLTLSGGTRTITVQNASGVATIADHLAGSGGFTKAGAGLLTLSGAGSTITGGVTIAGGQLALDYSSGTGTGGQKVFSSANNLTFTGSGQFTMNGDTTNNSTATMGALAFGGGEGTVESVFGNGTAVSSITFTGIAARTAGATGLFLLTNGTANNSISITGQATGFMSPGYFFGVAGGDNYAYYDSGGFVRGINYGVDAGTGTIAGSTTGIQNLSVVSGMTTAGSNTVTMINTAGIFPGMTVTGTGLPAGEVVTGVSGNTVTLSSGTGVTSQASTNLSFAFAGHLQLTGDVIGQGNLSIATLNLNGAGFTAGLVQTPGTILTLTTGGILKGGGQSAAITGGTIAAGANEFIVRADSVSDILTITSIVTGTGGLTKSGDGAVLLNPSTSGALTFGGVTTTAGSTSITLAGAAPGSLVTGVAVAGPGIPASTTIQSVSGTTVTLSNPVTANSPVPLTYQTSVGGGGTTVTLTSGQAGTLALGQIVTGTDVAPNTTVTGIVVATGVVTLSNATTGSTAILQNITFGGATLAFGNTQNYSTSVGPVTSDQATTTINNSVVNLLSAAPASVVPGMSVSGTGIAPGTTVASVSGTTVTLSQVASGSTPSIQNFQAQIGGGATSFLLPNGQAGLISPGSEVTGTNVPAGTTILTIAGAGGGNSTITLSQATTGSLGNQTLTFGGTPIAFGLTTLTLTSAQAATLVVGSTVSGGANIKAGGTTITGIQIVGSNGIVTLADPTLNVPDTELITFGGATVVSVTSPLGGTARVNAGTLGVNASSLPGGSTVTIAGRAELSAVNSTIANPISIAGGGATLSASGVNGGGFSGAINVGNNDFNLTATDFSTNVASNLNISGPIQNGGAGTAGGTLTVTSDSLGIVKLSGNNSNFTGPVVIDGQSATLSIARLNSLPNANPITINSGTLILAIDGVGSTAATRGVSDGTGAPQTLALSGVNVTLVGGGTIQPDHDGTAYGSYFTSAQNKTVQLNQLTLSSATLNVINNSASGVEFLGTTTMQSPDSASTFSVVNATASNLVPGLKLTGIVTGGPSAGSGGSPGQAIIKSGNGTLVLGNAMNSFGGGSSYIDIQGGVIAVASDGALGAGVVTVPLTGGQTSNGFTTITVSSTAGLVPGMFVSGPNIPNGSTIADVSSDGVSFDISQQATADSGATLSFTAVGQPTAVWLDGTTATLRATGTFSTARAITFNQANTLAGLPQNTIEVTGGNTLTVTTPFVLPLTFESNGLVKGENGTLIITANNNVSNTGIAATNVGGTVTKTISVSLANAALLAGNAVGRSITGVGIAANTNVLAINPYTGQITLDTPTTGTVGQIFAGTAWTGPITINAGAIQVQNGNALGSSTIPGLVAVSRSGAALQIGGGATVPDRLVINGTGLSSAGALQSLAGSTNTVTGQIALSTGVAATAATTATIGADATSVLNITGGITGTNTSTLTLNSNGAINITAKALDPIYTFTADIGTASATITGIADTSNIVVGQAITGSNIPSGAATIVNAKTAATAAGNDGTLTLSRATTGSATSGLTFNTQGFLNVIKNGTGTATLGVDSPSFVGTLTVNQGGFTISGSGVTIGTPAAANNITIQGPSGVLTVNDSIGSPILRLGGDILTGVAVVNGSNKLTLTPAQGASVIVGQPVFGANIPAGVTITANVPGSVLAGTTVLGSNTVTVPSVTGLVNGMAVSGGGLPAGEFITAIFGNNISTNGTTVANTATFTVANATALALGMTVTGANLPAGEVVTGISGNSITVSTGTGVAAGTASLTFSGPPVVSGTTTANSPSVTVASTAGLFVGMGVTGASLPANETIAGISGNTITLSNSAGVVAGTNDLTFSGNTVTVTTGTGVTDASNPVTFSALVTLSANASGTSAAQTVNFGPNRNIVLTGGTLIYNGNAAGSTELFGTLTSNRSATNVVQSNPSGSASVLLNFTSLTIGGDSSITFQGSGLGVNGTNAITFNTAPGMTNNIIQRATVNGTDFASYNTTGAAANAFGIQVFNNYVTGNNINLAATTATLDITADPGSGFTGQAVTTTINAFRISGNTTAVGLAPQGAILALTAGAILSPSGTNAVNFPIVSFGGTEAFIAVNSGTLSIGSQLTGSGGFVKALPGTLFLNPSFLNGSTYNRAGIANLSAQTLTGNLAVNGGTLKLGGGNNTLTPNQFLIVAPGATVDLNGTSQFALGTRGDGALLQGNAGTFTNTSTISPANLIFGLDSGTVEFGGVITQAPGAMATNFFKGSGQTYDFYNANTYTGATVLAGGINDLRDGGTLGNTSSIALNYGRLSLNDNNNFAMSSVATSATTVANTAAITVPNPSGLSMGMSVSGTGIPAGEFIAGISGNTITLTTGTGVAAGTNTLTFSSRVNLSAPIAMSGGSIVYTGRAQAETMQAVGAVTLTGGENYFQALIPNVTGATSVTDATLSLASLSRTAGSSATVRFADVNPASTGVLNFGGLGRTGNNGRIIIGTAGGAADTAEAVAVSANNNLVGPWAVVDREFASYIPAIGFGALNTVGFAGYSPNFLNLLPTPGSAPADNIRTTLNTTLAVNTTVNTLAVNTVATNVNALLTIDLGGQKLTLAGGGLLLAESNTATTASQAIAIQNGTITSTGPGVGAGSDLYIHALNYGGVNNTFVLSAAIVDNGTGPVRFVKASGAPDVAITSATADYMMITGTAFNFGGTNIMGGSTLLGSNVISVVNPTGLTVGMSVTGNGLPANEFVTAINGNSITITTGTGVTDTTTLLKNTYSGGTVINGGNLLVGTGGNIPGGGITIGGGEVVGVGALIQDLGAVIASSNTVTINSLGALNLTGNNTLQGLVFNDTGIGSTGSGGNVAPTVTTFRPVSALGTGTLTLGGGGIVSNPVDAASPATVQGRLDFGTNPSTVLVNPYVFGGVTDYAPTTAGLILQGVIGSSGGINKTGAGVLQFAGQDVFTGPINVLAGGIQLGATNAGSRFSALSLAAGTRFNLNNASTVIGSLSGSGTVTSTVGGPTLTVGFDNTSTVFSGQFSRFNDATPNAVALVKVGTGTLVINSVQSATNGSSAGVTVSGGGLTYNGNGTAYPSTALTAVTYTVNTNGTLTLDNSGTNVTNRMGLATAGTLNLSGGVLVFIGNSAGSSETINTLNFSAGSSNIQVVPGLNGPTTLTVSGTGLVSNQGGQDTGVISGTGLGTNLGANGSANVVVNGTLTLAGAGGGAGSDTMSIRPDLLGDTTAGGLGTGFLTRDTGNVLRPLNQTSELAPDMIQALTDGAATNVGLTSANNTTGNLITANQTINSLTLLGTGTPGLNSGLATAGGVFGPSGGPLTLTVSSGGILALTNATLGVAIASGGTTEDIHVVGAGTTLTLNASIVAATNGIVKADDGTLIFNAPQYFTGVAGSNGLTINDGTVVLNSGNNTILVQPTASIPSVRSLFLNGGTLDLNGTSQAFERISNVNTLAGGGGNIINSGGSPVILTTASAAATTFSGSIGTGATNNAISLVEYGAGILTLTNANTFNGTTTIRGAGLTLQDSGSLTNTTAISINYGTLLLNEGGLNPVTPVTRVPATAPITLNGGTISQTSGGSLNSIATFNTVNLASGANVITQSTVQSAGSAALINIGSLVQSVGTTVNFASSNGTLGGGGLNNNEVVIGTITPAATGSAVPTTSLLVNNMLPGWITVNGSDFAGYIPSLTVGSQGIGALGSTNFPAYSGVIAGTATGTGATPIANSSNNLSITATLITASGPLAANPIYATSTRVNSLAVRAPGAATVVPLNLPTDTLTIGSGGLLINTAQTVTLQGGRISAASVANQPGTLYVTANGAGAITFNSQIVDSGNQTYSGNTDGISNVITVGSTSGLSVGQTVSGPGIPLPVIASNALTTAGSNNIIVSSVSGIPVTSPVIGAGLPAGEFITAAAASGSVLTTGPTTTGSNVIPVSSTSGLAAGLAVSGSGLPVGEFITAVAPSGSLLVAGASTTAGSATIAVPSVAGLAVGMAVSGTGLPAGEFITAIGAGTITVTTGTGVTAQASMNLKSGADQITVTTGSGVTAHASANLISPTTQITVTTGTGVTAQASTNLTITPGTIVAITSPTTFTIVSPTTAASFAVADIPKVSSITTSGSTAVTLPNVSSLAVGQYVSGPGIPAGTTITALPTAATPNVVTLSNAATFTSVPVNYFLLTGTNTPSLTVTAAQAATLTPGMTVTGTNIPANTTILFVSGTTVTLSQNMLTNKQSVQNVNFASTLNFANLASYRVANASTVAGSSTVAVTNSNLWDGMTVSGPGIPANAIIGSLSGTTGINLIDATTKATVLATASINGINLTFGTPITIGNGSTGALTFVKTGTGTLTLTPQIVMEGSLNGSTVTVPTTAGLSVGMPVTGAGIPASTTIAGINAAASTITLNNGATGSGASQLSFGGLSNTYTGGTFVNQGTLNLAGFAGTTLIPGDLTINGSTAASTVTMLTNPQQIAAASNVTISGSGVLNLIGANTLASLTFANVGGNATPTVALGTNGTLTLTNGVTVTNDNLSLTPTISGTTSSLVLPNSTITVGGASPDGLLISVPITPTGALAKAGTGSLILTAASTFTTGVNLNAGSIILGASSTPVTGTVTSGPLGTGTLTMQNGTALLSDGTLRTIANSVIIVANATFGTLTGNGASLAGNGVTLAGPVTLTGGGAHTITVPDLLNVTTISGALSGGANLSLTKNGTGTLVLSNAANTYTSPTAINVTAGVLKLGAAGAVPLGLNLTVSPGAEYDIAATAGQVLGTLAGGGLVTNSGAAQTLYVGGTSTGDTSSAFSSIFSGILTAATPASLSLTKVGTGTVTLTGANLYTGNTGVNVGTLIVNGSLANTNVTVLGGASLGGSGSIGTSGGSVLVAGGSATHGTIDLTTDSAIGTLSIATTGTGTALTLGGTAGNSSVLNFNIGSTSTDQIALGSSKLLLNAGGATVNLSQLAGTPLAPSIYNLITFNAGSTLTGTFTIGNGFQSGWTLNVTGSSLQLLAGVQGSFTWKGATNGNWSPGSNWVSGTAPSGLATAIFDSTGSATPSTVLDTPFAINQLQYNASAPAYTIGGSSSLTLTGGIVINSGAASQLISTTVGVVLTGSNIAWANSSANNLTVSAPLSGTAGLTITSSSTGKVILSGNNSSFTGGITVSGNGTNVALQLGSATALGPVAGPDPLLVNLGAVDLFGQSPTVSSLSSTVSTGIIENTGAASTFTVAQTSTTTYSGKLGIAGAANIALVLNGGGTLQLTTSANLYAGGTTINNGTLVLGNGANENASGLGTGLVTINAAGSLNLNPGNVATVFNIPNSFTINGGGVLSVNGIQHLATSGSIAIAAAGANFTPSTTAGRDMYLDGQVTGSGPINVGGTGSGKVILTNNTNTYNGTLTTNSAGNLELDVQSALASAALVNNGPGLKFGASVTAVTLGSLAGQGAFVLANINATPAAVALTVGGNNTSTTYSGVISNAGTNNVAPNLLGSIIKTGTGTLILSGLNTYHGTTTVQQGTLRVSNASIAASVTGTGAVSVTGTATLGGNGLIQGGDNVSGGSVTLASGTFLDPGIAPATAGTLRIGPAGASPQPTNFLLNSGSTYKFDVGAGSGNADRVIVVGPATITGANLAINQLSVPDQGIYNVLSSSVSVTGTFGGSPAVPTGYKLVYSPASVDLQHLATIGAITPDTALQVIAGSTTAFNFTVANSAPTGSANLSFTANSTPGMNTSGSVTTPVSVTAGSAGSASLTFNAASLSPGLGQQGTFTVTDASATTASVQGTVLVDVLAHASFGSFVGGTLTLANARLGYATNATSTNSLSVTNTAGIRVNLAGSSVPNGANPNPYLSLSSIGGVLPGSSSPITASLVPGQGVGTYSQAFTYTFADDSTLNGHSTNLGTVTINATGGVYNGQGIWGAFASGSWGTNSGITGNWTLTNAIPGGVPGLDGTLSIDDTATIGSSLTGTLSLNGASPAINTLNLSNSGTIAQGSGGTLTLQTNSSTTAPSIGVTGTSVSPTISAPLNLANTTTVTVAAGDQLTISGAISGLGSAGLVKAGPGNLVLGSASFAGKTTVTGGTLMVSDQTSFGTSPGITVADQISISGGATLAFSGSATLTANQGVTVGTGGGNISVASGKNVTVGGAISGSATPGPLTKTGPGTLTLLGGPSSEALVPVTVNQGTLAVSPTTATINSLNTGPLTLNGSAVTASGGGIALNLLAPNVSDSITSSGQIIIQSQTKLSLNLGYGPTAGDSWVILTSNEPTLQPIVTTSFFTVNGTLATDGTQFLASGYMFKLFYSNLDSMAPPGTILLVAQVPEPGSLAMLLSGCSIFAGYKRIRRRKSVV